MSNPFAGWKTNVALDAISTIIEVDLEETIGDLNVPELKKPQHGVLM